MTSLDCRARRALTWMAALVLLASTGRAVAAEAPAALLDAMAQGKLDADLGNHDAAARTFSTVAEAKDAPPSLRGEALVRLAGARRAGGDYAGGMEAFDAAWKHVLDHEDRDTLGLMVQALNEPMPSAERWGQIWKRVVLVKDDSDPTRPTRKVVWPDVPPPGGRTYTGHPISLDFKNGNLNDIFRLMADVSGTNTVIVPRATEAAGKLTMHVKEMPWDKALELMLAPNGLVFRLQDNVLFIGTPEQIGPERTFSGARIDVRFNNRDVREALQSLAQEGGATVVIDEGITDRVTLLCSRVRWDQAFDVVARSHGLDWSRNGDTLVVARRPGAAAAVAPIVSAPAPPKRTSADTGLAELRLQMRLDPAKREIVIQARNDGDRAILGFTLAVCLAEVKEGDKKRLLEHAFAPPLAPTTMRDFAIPHTGPWIKAAVVEIRYPQGRRRSHFRGCP
jgi:hypothetical protein